MSQSNKMKLGAIHPLSGRQWDLTKATDNTLTEEQKIEHYAWPDLEIVLPFSRRVTDFSGTIKSPTVSVEPESIGGYTVTHCLNEIKIDDLRKQCIVPGVNGVWAASPKGDTARIHLLASDPYSWLSPHVLTFETICRTPLKIEEQGFDVGQTENFTDERRFGNTLLKPHTMAELIGTLQPYLSTRILKCNKFILRFQTIFNEPIVVDHLSLLLVGRKGTQEEETRFLTATKPDDERVSYTVSCSKLAENIYGDINLYVANLSLPLNPPIDTVQIKSSTDNPILVYAVRHREARKRMYKGGQKTILTPGRYKITVNGTSTASSHINLLDIPKSTVNWHLEQEFGVKYPETLRPYIKYTTIGDNRIFSNTPIPQTPDPLAWNPTMPGIGFPIYRNYSAVIHFLVPYMNAIFKPIRMRVIFEKDGTEYVEDIDPTNNKSEEISLPKISQDWIQQTIPKDEELIFSKYFRTYGYARVILSYIGSNENETKLDEWNCYISRFNSFSEHIEWHDQCVQTFFGPDGKYCGSNCGNISPGYPTPVATTINSSVLNPVATYGRVATPSTILKPTEELPEYPKELTSAPSDWRLSTALTDNLKPLDQQTSIRFVKFASSTGARFNEITTKPPLSGIQDRVKNTAIQAVVDIKKRPIALWLRTTEPVDWRRVTTTLTIKHVIQTGQCPSGYAYRKSMKLTVTILPSPDASSAFLVGSFAGIPMYLPRGEYELSLSFDPRTRGLEKLRPGKDIISAPEKVTFKFIQSSGLDFPKKQ